MPTYDITNSSIYNNYVWVEGPVALGTHAGITSWAATANKDSIAVPETAIRFRATIGTLAVHCYQAPGAIRLTIDEVDSVGLTLGSTGSYADFTLSSSLDSANEHEYLVTWGTQGNDGMFVSAIVTSGGSGLNTNPLPQRRLCAFYGDSITAGQSTGSSPADATTNWTHHVGRLAGYCVANLGIGGTLVSGAAADAGQNRTSDITGISPQVPSVVLIMYGVNDVIGAVGTSTFGTAYQSMLTQLRAGLPGVTILCEAIMHHQNPNTTDQDAYNAEIVSVISGLADPLIFYRTGGYDNFVTANGPLHPNIAGSCQVGCQIANDLVAVAGYGAPRPPVIARPVIGSLLIRG